MQNILYALEYIHKCGVVHRDIKLDNIMFCKRGDTRKIKIIDFGFSHVIGENFIMKSCGTPAFIAPEVVAERT